MTSLSPKLGELLLQATQSHDLDEALHKIVREYLELKLAALVADIGRLEEKWGCDFAEFKDRTRDDYSYEAESDFWEWERLETLKTHYHAIQGQAQRAISTS
ncbi:MAG: hypothetical protein L0177_19155 [Chloroflexi bacterium]|nr:hypothetical protein [Chloroflexota bacterium]